MQICCPLSRLYLRASVLSVKWHCLSTLFSVFLFFYCRARSLQSYHFSRDLSSPLMMWPKYLNFLLFTVASKFCWHLPVPRPTSLSSLLIMILAKSVLVLSSQINTNPEYTSVINVGDVYDRCFTAVKTPGWLYHISRCIEGAKCSRPATTLR